MPSDEFLPNRRDEMKFQLMSGGWPVGQNLIPAGTTVDTTAFDWAWLLKGPLAGAKVPPVNAQALDQNTYDRMCFVYGPHRVHYGPGVTPSK